MDTRPEHLVTADDWRARHPEVEWIAVPFVLNSPPPDTRLLADGLRGPGREDYERQFCEVFEEVFDIMRWCRENLEGRFHLPCYPDTGFILVENARDADLVRLRCGAMAGTA